MTYHKDNNIITYKISSRALQDFLAGRINEKQFRSALGESEGDTHVSVNFLDHGYIFKNIYLKENGLDEDDDEIVFEFRKDPSASPFE